MTSLGLPLFAVDDTNYYKRKQPEEELRHVRPEETTSSFKNDLFIHNWENVHMDGAYDTFLRIFMTL